MSLKRKPATGVILNILVVCAMVVWIAPTLGLLTTSLRPERDALTTCWWTVLNSPLKITQYTLEDYRRVVSTQGLGAALRNSLVIASVSALVPVMVAAYAVFGFAHPAFRRNTAFFAALVGLVAVPLAMTFAPALRIHSRLGPSGSLVGLWLVHTGYGLPFAVFMLRSFFSTLPSDLFESAYIDGASPVTAFVRVALPLSVPALASLVIFQFLWTWNDLLVALIYLGGNQDVAQLTMRLPSLAVSYGQSWPVLTSAVFISIVFPLVVFLCLLKYFARGYVARGMPAGPAED